MLPLVIIAYVVAGLIIIELIRAGGADPPNARGVIVMVTAWPLVLILAVLVKVITARK